MESYIWLTRCLFQKQILSRNHDIQDTELIVFNINKSSYFRVKLKRIKFWL